MRQHVKASSENIKELKMERKGGKQKHPLIRRFVMRLILFCVYLGLGTADACSMRILKTSYFHSCGICLRRDIVPPFCCILLADVRYLSVYRVDRFEEHNGLS